MKDIQWTRAKLLDLIEFTRASGSCYGITNIYDQFLDKEDSERRGWYVVSYRPYKIDGHIDCMEVCSIKRLSDGEVFSLGDALELDYDANNDRITEFHILGDTVTMLVDDHNGVDIKSAKKLNHKNKKIFTEYDLEAAFNFSRERLFNRDGQVKGYRFGNFKEYLEYIEHMKKFGSSVKSKP